MRTILATSLALALLLPAAASAELYHWVDAAGRIHFTDDSSRVPASERAAVSGSVPRSTSASWNRIQRVSSVRRSPAVRSEATVPLVRDELGLRVDVRVNGADSVPFVVDTGATINVIPRALALGLGLDLNAGLPTVVVRGISAESRVAPVVLLDELRVGDAVVRKVQAAVLDEAPSAILGMPFLSRFRVQLDPVAGTLGLSALAEAPLPAAGLPRFAWNAVPGAARYRVQVAADADFERVLRDHTVAATHAPLARAERLRPSIYYWRVSAIDERGNEGAWSDARAFRLLALARAF